MCRFFVAQLAVLRNQFSLLLLGALVLAGLAPNSQAAVDQSFSCVLGGESGEIFAMVRQPDGKYLIGGNLASVKGVVRYGIARLLPSGEVDTTFDAGVVLGGGVSAIALVPGGRVLMGGSFTNINGSARFGLASLNSDGSLDAGFNPNAGVARNGKPFPVTALAVQPDGRILIGGNFDTVNGVARKMIARLSADGILDTNFVGEITSGSSINALALQDGGKILVGGGFSSVSNTNRKNLARLLSDGRLDTAFDPLNQVYSTCYSILPLADGRTVVAGNNYCRRLAPDGKSLDASFIEPELGQNSSAYTISALSGGGYAVGGEFYESGNRFNLFGVAFGTNSYVAVGDSVVTYRDEYPNRADLVNFKSQGGLRSLVLTSVAFGSNHFVAVNHTSDILRSADGTNWTARSTDALLGFNHVAAANGMFVAVGPGGAIRTSLDDGASWQPPANAPTSSELNAVVGNGSQWVAVGGNAGAGVVLRSTDGSTWSSSTPTTNILYGVAYGSSQFVAVGEHGCILTSPDGQGWNQATNQYADTLYSIAYGNNLFIAVGANGRILYSPNGSGWTNVYNYSTQLPLQPLRCVTYANTKFVAVGGNGTVLVSDPAYGIPNLYFVLRYLTDRDGVSALVMDDNGLLRTNFVSGINDLLSNDKETVRAIAPETNGLVVAGNFVKVNNTNSGDVARLKLDGTLDLSMSMNMGAASEGTPSVFLTQPDGKTLIGGDFTSVNGLERPRLVRVKADGSVDTAFDPGVNVDRPITSIASCPNGQLMVGGNGNVFGSRPVARLNANGSVDPSFFTTLGGSTYNDIITAMAVQSDGKVILNGSSKKVARLNTNGTDDVTFNIGTGVIRGAVSSIALQPDGKILLAGFFTNFNGRTANGLVRLWPAGTNDEPFLVNYGTGTTQGVSTVLVRTSSAPATLNILLGGPFTNLSGLACGHLARLTEDGTPDSAFAANSTSFPPFKFDSLSATANGTNDTINLAGAVTNNGSPAEYFAFVNASGSLRSSLYSSLGPDGRVYAIAPFSENQIFVGGYFKSVDGSRWLDLVRLQEASGAFAQWKAAKFTTAELTDPAVSGYDADPDHDGFPNFVEYALNSEPKVPDRPVLPTGAVQFNSGDGKLYLLFSYHRRTGNSGVQYSVEASNDLKAWETTATRFEEISVSSDGNGLTETVTVRVKPSVNELAGTFVRLVIRGL